jgi:hypothetical protein
MRPAAVLQSLSTISPLPPNQTLISVTLHARENPCTLGELGNRASGASLQLGSDDTGFVDVHRAA